MGFIFNKGAAAAPAGPAAGGFARKAAPAAAAPAAVGGFGNRQNAAPKKSSWAGIRPAGQRAEILRTGDYVVRVISDEVLDRSGYWQSLFEIVYAEDGSDDKVGDRRAFLQGFEGKQRDVGPGIIVAYLMAVAGYEESDFDTYEAECGDAYVDACKEGGKATPNAGRLVHVAVSRQKEKTDEHGQPELGFDGKPDYFRGFAWEPIGEEEAAAAGFQQAPMPGRTG
jgi:hypothetical protein